MSKWIGGLLAGSMLLSACGTTPVPGATTDKASFAVSATLPPSSGLQDYQRSTWRGWQGNYGNPWGWPYYVPPVYAPSPGMFPMPMNPWGNPWFGSQGYGGMNPWWGGWPSYGGTPIPPSGGVTPPPVNPDIAQEFQRHDRNLDGRLTQAEYIDGKMADMRWIQAPTAQELQQHRARIAQDFQISDTNRDGSLTLHEYANAPIYRIQ